MAFGQTVNILLMVAVGAAFAEFEIISGPEENSNLTHLFCNEFWVAWSNNSDPFYGALSQEVTRNRTNETLDRVSMLPDGAPVILNVTDDIVVYRQHAIQVLSGSHPIFFVKYFEEGENGSMGRPVICATPPGSVEADLLLLSIIYVTTSLAIIASLIALLTYILLKQLRTLPGLVIMNLLVAFIAGDVLTQIRVSLAYRGVGPHLEVVALNQGLLIARYVWMSLTGFEMCRSLYQGVRLIGTNRPYHKLIMISIYMAIGWSIPTILAVIMYGVEKGSTSKLTRKLLGAVGYLTYHTTIGLTLLFNIAVVIFISVIFYNAAKRQKRLKSSYKNQNINFIRLFLIILTVLGLVWISFFVLQEDVVRGTRAIVIIYVILTATQPIFVCIAFVCTPKVYKMYLIRFGIRQEGKFPSKTSQRQGTMTSLYSERDLQRGRTIISIVSDKEFPSPDKTTAALPTIQEGDEEDVTTVENGKTVMEAVNSVPLSNGFHSPTRTGCPDKTHEQVSEEQQPSTSALSNGTNITNGLPIINGDVRGVSPSGSNNSLNPDREETNV